tara:strand:+ start:140488 stop:142899 length:2412 start_codon:yes stop_codon:yes gene_type:complete
MRSLFWVPTRAIRISCLLPILGTFLLTGSPAQSQPADVVAKVETAATPELDSAMTMAMIDAEIAALTQHDELPEEEKKDVANRLKQASQWLKAEQDAMRRHAEFVAQINAAPDNVLRLREELATPLPQIETEIAENATLAQLEARLNELRQATKERQRERDEIKEQIDGRGKRATKIAKEIADLEKRLADPAVNVLPAPNGGYLDYVQQIENKCHRQAMTAQLKMFRAESKRIEALAEQRPLELDAATRRVNYAERLLTKWSEVVEQWRRDESVRHAAVTRRMAEKAHPALGELATRNADIAQKRLETVKEIEQISADVAKLKAIEESIHETFASMRNRVEHAPEATSTGILLRKARDELPKLNLYYDRAAELENKTPRAHLLLNELEDERETVADPVSQSDAIVQSLAGELTEFSHEQVSGAVKGLLQTRRELLDKLIADQNTHLRNLSELEVINQDLIQEIVQFRGFLDEHVLWVRSTETVGLSDVSGALAASGHLMEPVRWNETLHAAVGETLRRPAALAAAIAFLILAFVFRKHVDRRLEQLCAGPKVGKPMQFGRALSGIGLSVVLSAGWPAILLALGYRLTAASRATEFSVGLGKAFLAVAALVWGCQLIREICLEGRVGHRMFLWPQAVLVSIRRTLEMTVLFGAPLIGILVLSDHVSVDGAASLHRLALVSTLAFVSLQCFTLLRSDGAIMKSIQQHHPGSMVCRFSRLIWVASIAAPMVLATISAVGYHYSATQLSGRFAESLVAILGLIVLHSLALRWLRINGYNRKLRERIAAFETRISELRNESRSRRMSR